MNAKSKLKVIYADSTIEMNTTFAKMMQNPLSDEYALLQRTRQDFPNFSIRTRQIKSNPNKDTYKGLTYDWMREYIRTHEPKEIAAEKVAAFNEMELISKCHRGSLRYPTIKKWFLETYPEVVTYGIKKVEKVDENSGATNKSETEKTNVTPLPQPNEQEEVELDNAG